MAKTENKSKIFESAMNYKVNEEFVNSAFNESAPTKTWTVEEIKSLLKTNDTFVIRSLLKLYSYQTEAEQNDDETTEHNGFGFNSYDAKALSGMVKILIKNFIISKSQVSYARTKLMKYSKQLTKIANGEF